MKETNRWKRIATAIGTHPRTLFQMLENPNMAKDCWHWNGGLVKAGNRKPRPVIYPFGVESRNGISVPRFFWSLILGSLDELDGIYVFKACPNDAELCVNPFHHYLKPKYDVNLEEYEQLPHKYLEMLRTYPWIPRPSKAVLMDQR